MIGISLYGEYFTDERERQALLGILERVENTYVWPVQQRYQMLKEHWELVDGSDGN